MNTSSILFLIISLPVEYLSLIGNSVTFISVILLPFRPRWALESVINDLITLYGLVFISLITNKPFLVLVDN